MRPTWLVCVLTVAMGSLVRAQTPLGFHDALALAHQHNQQLRAAGAQVDRSRADRAAERGLYFPTISAIAGYQHMNDRLFVDLNDLRPLLSALNPAVPIPLALTSAPALFLSGISFPWENQASWVRAIALALPTTFGIRGFVQIGEMGATLGEAWRSWGALWLQTLIYGLAAAYLMSRQRRAPGQS
jgi:outer membrane efflux protein/ABC-2 family transporter